MLVGTEAAPHSVFVIRLHGWHLSQVPSLQLIYLIGSGLNLLIRCLLTVSFSLPQFPLSLSFSFILSFKYVFTLHNRQIALRGKISKWQLGKFIDILP